jgi:thiamine biosynthesis lipoprotein
VNAAFAAFHVAESCMHPVRAGSDVQRIGRAHAGELVRVHPWTRATLAVSQWLFALTGGHFDPALPGQRGSVAHLQPEADDCVRVLMPVQLDLGGIARGFAIDRAIDALTAAGCAAGMVNAGGDLRVFGQQPRALVVRTSAQDGRPVVLHNRALAIGDGVRDGAGDLDTAGDLDVAGRESAARGGSRRAAAARATRSVAVIAASAVLADGLARCLALSPRVPHQRLLDVTGAALLAG